jgi:HSP20 family molecular chaperone IbpA
VIAATMHTNYKNGVLEIRLRKILQEKAIDEVAGQKNAT